MRKGVDAVSAVRSREDMPGAAKADSPLKPATLTRALKIYLFGFFGALAVTALLLLEPTVRGTAANRDAGLTATSRPGAEAPVPETHPEASATTVAPEAIPSPPVEMDAGKTATASASPPDARIPEAPAPSAVMDIAASPSPAPPGGAAAAIETAAAPSAAMPPESAASSAPPDVVVTPIPTHPRPAPAISQSPAAARPPTDTARGRSRQMAGYPARPRRSLPRDAAIGRGAEPALRGSEGASCPEGSDPWWSAPDGSGASALICNPYYPRVSVSVF
jgi:hypothetical protein